MRTIKRYMCLLKFMPKMCYALSFSILLILVTSWRAYAVHDAKVPKHSIRSVASITKQSSESSCLIPLKINLPASIGTDPGYMPNKDKKSLDLNILDSSQPRYLVPKDVTLISLHKPVTSSDMEPIIGELDLINDGETMSSDGCFVQLASGLQWVQIDLKESCDVYAIVVWHDYFFHYVYNDVIVMCSEDPLFRSNVKILFNNDCDNSSGFGVGKDREYIERFNGKLIGCKDKDSKSVQTRYLRFYSNGNNVREDNRYVEIDVYGRPEAKTK